MSSLSPCVMLSNGDYVDYLYDDTYQLTRETVGGTNTDYLYDANGSLTKKDDGTNVYSYDSRNP